MNVSGGLSSGNATLPDVSFIENNLSELPDILLDPEILTASSCLVRQNDSTGSLVIANADELSQQPGDSRSVYSTGDVQPITPPLSGTAQTIEEPERIFQLSDGRLMLSQPCF